LNELPFGVPPFCFRHVFLFESPPEAFPPISHKHEKPKERRHGQGREAPEGHGLDCAAAFGNVPWLDGTERKELSLKSQRNPFPSTKNRG